MVSLLIILISSIFFTINFSSQDKLATYSFQTELEINSLNSLFKTHYDLVLEKRKFQSLLSPASRSNYIRLKSELAKELDSLRMGMKQFPQFEANYTNLFLALESRLEQLDRHLAYFDQFSVEVAQQKIQAETDEIQSRSAVLELAYQQMLKDLLAERDQFTRDYFAKARFNYIGFIVLFVISLVLLVANYFLGQKQQKLSLEKQQQRIQFELAQKDTQDFQTSFDNAAIGMGLVDDSGRWIRVNSSLCKMLGYTPEELINLTFQEITHPEDLFADLEQAKRLRNREIESYTIEKRYITKSGEIVWINLNGTAVWEEDGHFRYFIAQIENITPRKKYFADLKVQKERFEYVIEGTQAGTWEWNVQTGETVFNETWANIIGYQLEEISPVSIDTWMKYAHPDDLEQSNQKLQACFSKASDYYECECRMRHKDGHWVWVLDRGKVMTWTADGKPEKMYGTHTEISKFKELEYELSAKNAFTEAVLDTIDVGIVVANADGQLNRFNKATLEFHGLESKNISPDEWPEYYQLLTPDLSAHLSKEDVPLYRAWKGEKFENREFAIRHSSGDIRHISCSGSPIYTENHEFLGAVVAMKDISAEKIYKQTLLESERKFKGIFNSTFQFIGFLDLEGNLLEANQTALDFGGLRQEDVVGKKFWDCHWWQVSPQTQKQLQDAIQMAAKGEFVQYEVAVWDRDKRPVTILFNLKPIFNEEGKVFAIIPEGRLIQDIVDAREALKDKNVELQRFASVASHDLKEPLRMVINFLQLLHRKYDPILDDKGRQYIQFAVDASQRMNTLISELLEYSQLGNLDTPKEWVDTNSVVQTVLDYYSTTLEESGGRVYFSSLPNLWVRKVPFELLIRNLLGNSLKYRKPEIPPQITLSAMELENHWEFAVRDNGIGFEPEHAKSIFQMFKRLHTRQEFAGTGMGLATCQRIVEQHDGEIWAESIPGQGSVFRFTLAKPDSC